MRRHLPLSLCVALLCCARPEVAMSTGRDGSPTEELDRAISAAAAPETKGRPNPVAADALAYLRAHAAAAHARIVAQLDAARPLEQVGLCHLLGRLALPEGVAPLGRVLSAGKELAADAAARALAVHPAAAARAALIDGLGGAHPGTVIASADGLAAAKEEGCVALRRQLGHEDAIVRYHVVSAGLALECLTSADLERVARDKDHDVAALAHKPATK